MYRLPEFIEQDNERILNFMKSHPFVTLIGANENNSVATQVPVLFNEKDGQIILRGHIMRGTDHFKAFQKADEVLVLFQGPQCYVSASWYSERGIGGTWNYMTVHGRGKLNFYEEHQTIQLLKDLTRHHESDKPNPELVENMAEEYVSTMVKAIAGFEIKLTSIEAVFKLSQNRDDESYKKIVTELLKIGKPGELAIVKEMKERRPQLF
jgi:transcriptional regulator